MTPPNAPDQLARAPFSAMLRGGLLPSLVAGVLTVVVAWVVRGGTGALAAVLGVILAMVFFAGGLWVMTRIVGAQPISLMAGALAVYFGQVIVLGVVILSLYAAAWLDGPAFGVSILVVTLVWQVFQVRAFIRSRRPVYDEPVYGAPGDAAGEMLT